MLSTGCVKAGCNSVKRGSGPLPSQLSNIFEELDIGPKCGQGSKQQRPVPLSAERVSQSARARRIDMPFAAVLWNGFEMQELCQNGG